LFADPSGKGRVLNRSCRTIIVKTELGDNQTVEIKQGGDVATADGIYNGTPDACNRFCGSSAGDLAFKINDDTDTVVTGGCGSDCLRASPITLDAMLSHNVDRLIRGPFGRGPGWKDATWFRIHPDWVPDRLIRPTPCCP
jgi:hypothetical protein